MDLTKECPKFHEAMRKAWAEYAKLWSGGQEIGEMPPKFADMFAAGYRAALASQDTAPPAAAPAPDHAAALRTLMDTLGLKENDDLHDVLTAANLRIQRLAAAPEQAVDVKLNEGFFAGCTVKVDPNMPPDTIEMRGANRVRLNIKTGEITELSAQAVDAPVLGDDLNWLLSDMDGQKWADEFCKRNPSMDHGLMLGWFCCAIMTGFDEANRRRDMEGAAGTAQAVDSIGVMQRALLVIEGRMCNDCSDEICCMPHSRASRDELRAALAAQPAAPAGEPVAMACSVCYGSGTDVAGRPCPFGCLPRVLAAPVANAGQADDVPMPTSAAQAELMAKLGMLYLQQHAPDRLTDAWQAQAQAVAVPDGWRLVPVEPTDDMRCACVHGQYADKIDEDWAAMLAAAPLPQQVAQTEAGIPASRPTSRDAYLNMTPERRAAFDADMTKLDQRIAEHRRSRDRRTHDEPVAEDRRKGDRRHVERRDCED